uniref:vacuolar protein sorting-associated protein 13C-like n=1 Tax=Oncorhynchus gorbuscha TaxID=8017 RepID=UPI001EAE97F8
MVFESMVSDLLNRFIGDYVENLDKSQLKIGIWGGNVVLENLKVKENALSELDVPFKVKAGQIGKLTLKIPWKNLYNDAVVATLDGLYLLVVPGATVSQLRTCPYNAIKYDAAKEERYQQEAKQKELQRIEEALLMAARREKPQKDEKKDTFAEKLATQVIKNLQVKITSIHIRYEDDILDPQQPLSMGVTLAELSLQTTDENWKSCILNEAARIIYKLGRLECLCAYWNVNSPIFYKGSWEEILVMTLSVFIRKRYWCIQQSVFKGHGAGASSLFLMWTWCIQQSVPHVDSHGGHVLLSQWPRCIQQSVPHVDMCLLSMAQVHPAICFLMWT